MKKFLRTLFTFTMLAISLSCFDDQDSNNTMEPPATSNDTGKSDNALTDERIEIRPSADTMTIALTLFRNDNESIVPPTETFYKDDGVKLNISTVSKGYLLILYKGSDGENQVIFPNKEFYNRENKIDANKTVTIPAKGWFYFDDKKGVEKIFVVYSENEDLHDLKKDPTATIEKLEEIELNKNSSDAFADEKGNLIRIIKLAHK
jgi:hypothetical protein